METVESPSFRIREENAILRNILEGTATSTGKHLFRALVENLAITLKTHSAWVAEYVAETRKLHALAIQSVTDRSGARIGELNYFAA